MHYRYAVPYCKVFGRAYRDPAKLLPWVPPTHQACQSVFPVASPLSRTFAGTGTAHMQSCKPPSANLPASPAYPPCHARHLLIQYIITEPP
jgi:hypothetical protein